MRIFKCEVSHYDFTRGGFMITFNPLWRTLDIKGISTYRLEHQYGMSKSMIHKLKHNQSITLQTLNQLCAMLDCNITDIIEYTKDE